VVRELGLERREAVRSLSAMKNRTLIEGVRTLVRKDRVRGTYDGSAIFFINGRVNAE